MKRNDQIKIHFVDGCSLQAKVRCIAEDGTFAIIEEGPGLSGYLRFNPSEQTPTWRYDGAQVQVEVVGSEQQ